VNDLVISLVRNLHRVPFWLWLCIAFSGALTFVDRWYTLPRLERTIQSLGNDPIKVGLERTYSEKRRDLVAAAIIGPVSFGLAYWKWSSSRPWARRLSLRTLLIATTLIAVVLGFAAYSLRK
jgi:hypothetical protein